jgi:hypothetical protein
MAEYKVTLTIELTVQSYLTEDEIGDNVAEQISVNFLGQDITDVEIESDRLVTVEVWQEGNV